MFRSLALLGASICALSIAAQAISSGRVYVKSGTTFARSTHPIAFVLITCAWGALGVACLAGTFYFLRQAALGIGNYETAPFFSFAEFWPYGIFAVYIWWVIGMIASDHIHLYRNRGKT